MAGFDGVFDSLLVGAGVVIIASALSLVVGAVLLAVRMRRGGRKRGAVLLLLAASIALIPALDVARTFSGAEPWAAAGYAVRSVDPVILGLSVAIVLGVPAVVAGTAILMTSRRTSTARTRPSGGRLPKGGPTGGN